MKCKKGVFPRKYAFNMTKFKCFLFIYTINRKETEMIIAQLRTIYLNLSQFALSFQTQEFQFY